MPNPGGSSVALSEKQKTKLRQLNEKNELGAIVLSALASIRQPRSTIDLRRLRDRIHEHTNGRVYLDQRALRGFFKEMQGMGMGTVIVGTGVNPDRFRWNYHMRAIIEAVGGEAATPREVEPIGPAIGEDGVPEEGIVIRFKWAGQYRVLPYGQNVKLTEIDTLIAMLETVRKSR
jgi:hypothetical protein